MNAYTALVGLATFGGAAYLLKMKKQKPEIFKSHNRYLLYNGLLFFGAIVFALAGLETGNNWFVLMFSILMALMNYYGPAWSKINQDIVCNTTSKTKLVVRPGLAVVIALTLAYQLTVVVVLIDTGRFSTINLARPEEAATNFWAWSYIVANAGLATGCMSLFTLECLKIATSITDTNTLNGLWHQYRVYAFAIIGLLDTIFFGLMLAGNLSYSFSPDGSFDRVCTALRNQALLLLCLVFLAQHFLDGKVFRWYVKWHKKRLVRLTEELEWLYNAASRLFEASYRLNPYTLKWNESQPVELSLNLVINCLNETRRWLYQKERKGIASAKESGRLSSLPKASIRSEAIIWVNHLNHIPQMEPDLSTGENKNVPYIKGATVESKAMYYVKLSKTIQNLLKHQSAGICNES